MLPAYERRNMLNNNMYIKPLFDRVIVSSIKGVILLLREIIPVVIGHKLCEGIIIEISGISELKIGERIPFHRII